MSASSNLRHPVPIWVSRKTAGGDVAEFVVSLWLFMFIGLLCLVNVLLWGGIGIYEAIRVIV